MTLLAAQAPRLLARDRLSALLAGLYEQRESIKHGCSLQAWVTFVTGLGSLWVRSNAEGAQSH